MPRSYARWTIAFASSKVQSGKPASGLADDGQSLTGFPKDSGGHLATLRCSAGSREGWCAR